MATGLIALAFGGGFAVRAQEKAPRYVPVTDAMLRKPEATKTVMRLLEEGHAISPDRYKTVATLILLDMHTWKDKDLGSIGRKMENIERRLDLARGGPQTQKLQKEVVARLDELIKELENKAKKKPGAGGS